MPEISPSRRDRFVDVGMGSIPTAIAIPIPAPILSWQATPHRLKRSCGVAISSFAFGSPAAEPCQRLPPYVAT